MALPEREKSEEEKEMEKKEAAAKTFAAGILKDIFERGLKITLTVTEKEAPTMEKFLGQRYSGKIVEVEYRENQPSNFLFLAGLEKIQFAPADVDSIEFYLGHYPNYPLDIEVQITK